MLIRFLILSPTLLFRAALFPCASPGNGARWIDCCDFVWMAAEGRRRDAMVARCDALIESASQSLRSTSQSTSQDVEVLVFFKIHAASATPVAVT